MIEYFRDTTIERSIISDVPTFKNKLFYLFYIVGSNFRCHPIVYTLLMLWSSMQAALLEISSAEGDTRFEFKVRDSMLIKVLFFYMSSFTFYGCIAAIGFLLAVFGIAIAILAKPSNLMNESNESSMKLPGKIYGIIFCLIHMLFELPIMVCAIQSYSCDLFSAGSSYKCNSIAHILVGMASGIIIVLLITLNISSSLFAQMGSLVTTPWCQCGISVTIGRTIKNVVIVAARCFSTIASITVFMSVALLSDIVLLVDLICWQHYDSFYIHGVDITHTLIGMWWDFGVIATLVSG
jgi:hypothetical protein